MNKPNACISMYGDYNSPLAFTLSASSPAAQILNQQFFDFSLLTTPTINIFLSAETRKTGGTVLYPRYGLFLLDNPAPPNGINPATLFTSVFPDVELDVAINAAFHGADVTAVISNPGASKQVIIAVYPGGSGGTDTPIELRSFVVVAGEV